MKTLTDAPIAALCVVLVASLWVHATPPAFEDVALNAFGGPYVHKHTVNQSSALFMTGGVAAGDFNRDGWQDLFLVSGDVAPDRLLLNMGDGTFADRGGQSGVAAMHHGSAVCVGDIDGDGWLDLFVTSFGSLAGLEPGHHRLYRNLGLDDDGVTPLFEEIAQQAGVQIANPFKGDGYSAAFGDFDKDGDLDLAVAGWVENDCPDKPVQQMRVTAGTRLFENNGDLTFTDVTNTHTPLNTDECPAEYSVDDPFVSGFAPRFIDMNGDTWPDLLITSDFGHISEYNTPSMYLINNGDGTFRDGTNVPGSGLGLDRNGMGQTVADVDLDGDMDWYVTNICVIPNGSTPDEPCNTLYLNNGDDTFVEASIPLGVSHGAWGWGCEFLDVDLDGDLDLAETNGWGVGDLGFRPTRLFMNQGLDEGGELKPFTEEALAAGLDFAGQGRGLIRLDYDNDGDPDLLIVPNSTLPAMEGLSDQPVEFYRNMARETRAPGDSQYLRVFLDTSAHPCLAPDGFGARLELDMGSPTPLVQYLSPGATYVSQSEMSAHFGFGTGEPQSLRVLWPNGLQTVIESPAVDQTITVAAPCAVDTDGNGAVNILDFVAFQGAFLAGNTAVADVDCDQGLSITDFIRYQGLFVQGCP